MEKRIIAVDPYNMYKYSLDINNKTIWCDPINTEYKHCCFGNIDHLIKTIGDNTCNWIFTEFGLSVLSGLHNHLYYDDNNKIKFAVTRKNLLT